MKRQVSLAAAGVMIVSVFATSGACSRNPPDSVGRTEITSGHPDTDMPGPTTAADKERLRRAEEAATRDLQITTELRHRLEIDDGLSRKGKSVAIVPIDGKVTLRGSVANAEEAAAIVDKARTLPNVVAVEDFLEYAPSEL
jgi:hypothetical protein